jgi:hypothetical protein
MHVYIGFNTTIKPVVMLSEYSIIISYSNDPY